MALGEWKALTKAVNEIKTVNTFILNFFNNTEQKFSDKVDINLKKGNQKLAPFVAPMDGGVVVSKMKTETSTVKVPRIRIKKDVTAADTDIKRPVDSGIYVGKQDIDKNRRSVIAEELLDLKEMVKKTQVWMACQALQGSLSVDQENISFNIDFRFPASHKITLTGNALWADPASKPVTNIRQAKRLVQQMTGLTVDTAICGSGAVDDLYSNEDLAKKLDNRNINIGELGTADQYKFGRIDGVNLYEFSEQYTDDDGVVHDMIPEDTVIFLSSSKQARLTQMYGLIKDKPSQPAVALPMFAKSWDTEDPAATWLLGESDPLFVPIRIGSIVVMKVR